MELDYWSNFPYTNNPVFMRGGCYHEAANSGITCFNRETSNTNAHITFRPVLATLWYNKFCLTY